jgi:integrase
MPDVSQIGLPEVAHASTLRGGKTAASASLDYGGSMARRRYQTGRVFVRGKKNPVFVGRWREDVILQDGSVQRVYKSAILGAKSVIRTEREALRRLHDEYLVRINAREYRAGRIVTLRDFAETWQKQVLVHKKPSTIKAAKSHLKIHILPILGAVRLDELSRERQQSFSTCLVGKVSRKSVLNVLGTLSTMLATAKEWKYVCEPLTISSLVLPEAPLRPAARFFSGEEAKQIIAAASDPYRSMFAIAAMTGLRAGEILGLQIDDLDFERRVLHIRRSAWCGKLQTVKSKSSRAPLPMPDALSEIIRQYLTTWRPNPAKLLFINRLGRPFSANKVVQKGLWPILENLKIEHCGLHAFRHTHTSLLFDVGAPPTVAQAQLRHSDPRITLGIYGHTIGDSHRSAVEKVAQILRPDAPKTESTGEWIQ